MLMVEKASNIEQYKVPLEKKKFKNDTERFPDYQAFKNALDQSSMGDLKVEDMKILKQGRRYAVEYRGSILGFVKGKEQFDNFMTQYLNQLKSKEAAGTTADVQVEISRKKVDVEVTHRLDNLRQDVLVHEIAIVQNIENYESLVLWLKNKRHELKNKIKDLRTQKGDYSDVWDQTIKDMIVLHKEQLDRMDAMDDKIVRLDKRGTSLDQQQTLIDFKSELIGILRLQSVTNHGENIIITQDKKIQDAVKEQKEQSSWGAISVDSPHDINGATYNNTTDAFAKGGIVGALDYRWAQSNMTRGQREFWKGAANIGMVAGGVYLGWTVLSKAFGVFNKDNRTEALKWIGGAAAITLWSQALTGKDPISVLRELANGWDTTKRIKQKIAGHDGMGIGPEVATNIEDCLDCALLLGAVDFKYYLDNKIIQFNAQGDPTIDTYKMNQLIDTKPMNFNAPAAKEKLKSVEKDPSLFTKWMNALGLSKNAMESQPTQNAPETYVAKQKEYMGTALDTRKLGDDLKKYKKSDKEQLITYGNVLANELNISDFHYEIEGDRIKVKTYGKETLIDAESFTIVDTKLYRCSSLEECLRIANLSNFLKKNFEGKGVSPRPFYLRDIPTWWIHPFSLGRDIMFDASANLDFSYDTKVLSWGRGTQLSNTMPTIEHDKQAFCDFINTMGLWKKPSGAENGLSSSVDQSSLEKTSLDKQIDVATNLLIDTMGVSVEKPTINKEWKIVLTFEWKNILIDSKTSSFTFEHPNGKGSKETFALPKSDLNELFLVAGRTMWVVERWKYRHKRKDDRNDLFYVWSITHNPLYRWQLMFSDNQWIDEQVWSEISDANQYPQLSKSENQTRYCKMLNNLAVWKSDSPENVASE